MLRHFRRRGGHRRNGRAATGMTTAVSSCAKHHAQRSPGSNDAMMGGRRLQNAWWRGDWASCRNSRRGRSAGRGEDGPNLPPIFRQSSHPSAPRSGGRDAQDVRAGHDSFLRWRPVQHPRRVIKRAIAAANSAEPLRHGRNQLAIRPSCCCEAGPLKLALGIVGQKAVTGNILLSKPRRRERASAFPRSAARSTGRRACGSASRWRSCRTWTDSRVPDGLAEPLGAGAAGFNRPLGLGSNVPCAASTSAVIPLFCPITHPDSPGRDGQRCRPARRDLAPAYYYRRGPA